MSDLKKCNEVIELNLPLNLNIKCICISTRNRTAFACDVSLLNQYIPRPVIKYETRMKNRQDFWIKCVFLNQQFVISNIQTIGTGKS